MTPTDVATAPVASDGAAAVASAPRSAPSALAVDLGVVSALWRRDMLRLLRERSRWLGVVLQPLLFWAILGTGLAGVFRVPGAGDVGYLAFSFPGILLMVVLFTTVFATMAVIEDRQQGFLQQVLVGPGGRWALVAGKTAGVTTVAVVQAALCLLAAPLAGFDLLALAWAPLLATLVLASVGLTGLSFSLAWVVGSTHGYHALMTVLLLPLWLVSGALFPPADGWLGVVMRANPMTAMGDGLRHAMHGGTAPLATWSPAAAFAVMGATALVTGALAVATTRRARGTRP